MRIKGDGKPSLVKRCSPGEKDTLEIIFCAGKVHTPGKSNKEKQPMILRQAGIVYLLVAFLALQSCGYRMRSSVGSLPEGVQSIGIPAFENLTKEFKVEQILTEAVLKEFNRRTRVRVDPGDSGVDAVLRGKVTGVQSAPVTFGSRSFGSAYSVSVAVSAQLVRLKDSKVLWQSKNFTFRERYALNSEVDDFFNEENPALERLARSFAESLVGLILESPSLDSSKP
jgi:hypothetical protein